MDENTLKSHLQKLDEFVLDEDKIVSYKFVSRNLGVHVNTAKQLLHAYLAEQQRLSQNAVSATYLIAGKVKDGAHIVSLVADSDWETTRSKFAEITSEHVYSVQKVSATSIANNSEVLYVADSNLKQVRGCVIKCRKAVQRTVVKKEEVAEPPKEVKSEKVAGNGGGVKENDKASPPKVAKGSNKNHIGNFFNNHALRRKTKCEETVEEKPVKEVNKSQRPVPSPDVENRRLEELSIADDAVPNEETGGKRKAANKSKTVENNKKKKKKRKRILSDSEDSDVVDDEMEDARMCMETDVPAGGGGGGGGRLDLEEEPENAGDIFHARRKRKKIVDETFEHEDGYIETKKVIVYETESEEEEEEATEAADGPGKAGGGLKKSPPGAAALPAKKAKAQDHAKSNSKKQSSLLTFFKKK